MKSEIVFIRTTKKLANRDNGITNKSENVLNIVLPFIVIKNEVQNKILIIKLTCCLFRTFNLQSYKLLSKVTIEQLKSVERC